MNLWLIDIQPDVVDAWRKSFADFESVSIRLGNILEHAENTIVSPANSYGYMDGGIDYMYIKHFGNRPQLALHEKIKQREEGYLPVGASVLVPTGDERIPYMISAPTMFLPEPIPAQNCFYAMAAVLQAADRHKDVVQDVYCPGLGTGVGQVEPDESATEMANAYRKWIEGKPD